MALEFIRYAEHRIKLSGLLIEKPLYCNKWVWLGGCGYNGHTNTIWLPIPLSGNVHFISELIEHILLKKRHLLLRHNFFYFAAVKCYFLLLVLSIPLLQFELAIVFTSALEVWHTQHVALMRED